MTTTTTNPTYAIAHGNTAVQAARIIADVAAKKEASQRERILRLAEERGIGVLTAKRIVLKEDLVADIHAASTIEDIKEILLRVVA